MSSHAGHLQQLVAGLRRALAQAGHPGAGSALEPLPDKGLAHEHVRIGATGQLARIPKQSQMGLPPPQNLAYQRACFERAAAGGQTPLLHAVFPPSADLPWGALIVEAIDGRPARLPHDLPAMARTFASLHALPMPAVVARAPLLAPADPLVALHAEVTSQWAAGRGVDLAAHTRATIEAGLARLGAALARPARAPISLIAFDGHPGNFIVEAGGRAVLVDLEKCRYGYAPLDLAHATLYTSTTWDVATSAELTVEQIAGFHEAWAAGVGGLADASWPHLLALREAMWLWSLTWCAKWLAVSGARAKASAGGEDWSHERSDARLIAHVASRVDHYLDAATIRRVQAEFAALARALDADLPWALAA